MREGGALGCPLPPQPTLGKGSKTRRGSVRKSGSMVNKASMRGGQENEGSPAGETLYCVNEAHPVHRDNTDGAKPGTGALWAEGA